MQTRYDIQPIPAFERDFRKLTKNNSYLRKEVEKCFVELSRDPFEPGLKTHKVMTAKFGRCYSSRVSGDIRIIWDFVEGKRVILALALGGHEGKRSVYKHEWRK